MRHLPGVSRRTSVRVWERGPGFGSVTITQTPSVRTTVEQQTMAAVRLSFFQFINTAFQANEFAKGNVSPPTISAINRAEDVPAVPEYILRHLPQGYADLFRHASGHPFRNNAYIREAE